MKVGELRYDLSGHDCDKEVKIKLRDGTIKELAGVQYRDIIVNGDGIIYLKEQAMYIRNYIDETFADCSEGFRDDFEHHIRGLCLRIDNLGGCGAKITEICKPECHFDILINNTPSDIWVTEQGTNFNPVDVAQTLYKIYMGEVGFKK